ncbi:hypothetical protein ACFY2N_34140 [Streptomyces rubiginosohelvolus]|uniref:hypothetical protein n=1 Tax=Streptomyces rubiginosohelvolus TaxID=67362 RepID=UPI003684FAD4
MEGPDTESDERGEYEDPYGHGPEAGEPLDIRTVRENHEAEKPHQHNESGSPLGMLLTQLGVEAE